VGETLGVVDRVGVAEEAVGLGGVGVALTAEVGGPVGVELVVVTVGVGPGAAAGLKTTST